MQFLVMLLVCAWGIQSLESVTYRYNSTSIQTDTNHTIMKVGAITKPGCQSNCGSLNVPYPFGILSEGQNCSMNDWFSITCDTSTDLPRAFLSGGNLEIFDISDTELRINNILAESCYDQSGSLDRNYYVWVNLEGSLTFSEANVLTIVGCDDYANIYQAEEDTLPKGCSTTCHNAEEVLTDECSGTGCCQVTVNVHKYFDIYLDSYDNHTSNMSYNPCGYAFLGEKNAFKFGGLSDLNDTAFTNKTIATVPIVLDWVIDENKTCDQARQDSNSYACKYNNSHCVDVKPGRSFGGYRCSCLQGYEGNPYLSSGCKDIDECADPSKNDCEKNCINIPGNYSCSCPEGYNGNGDGRINGSPCVAKRSKFPMIQIILGNILVNI